MPATSGKTHIIIGASAAGIGALNTLARLDPVAQIICITGQQETPYNKCHLVDYCVGIKSLEQLSIFNPARVGAAHITFMHERVTALEPQQKLVTLSNGQQISYDTLFIGTGASPYIPPVVPTRESKNIFTFHTLYDAQQLLQFIADHKPTTAIVIGAGLSGLECADALAHHKMSVTVIEAGHQLLAKQVTAEGAELIVRAANSHKTIIMTNNRVEKIIPRYTAQSAALGTNGRGIEVALAGGQEVSADLLVFATGVRPNSQLAQATGIQLNNGFIVVDEHQQTSISGIYAGGDVAMVKDQFTGNPVPSCVWPDAMLQGLIAAHAMAGQPRPYPGAFPLVSSAFFGVRFASYGPIASPPEGTEVIVKQGADFHHTYLIKDSCLIGFCLVGDIGRQGELRRILLTRQEIDKEQLLTGF